MNILSNTLINTKNIRGLQQHQQQQPQQEHIDTDIDNYSVNDILTIFNLLDEPSLFQIKDVANNLIARMKSEGKIDMALFFEKAKQKVITEMEREDDDDDDDDDDDEPEEDDREKHTLSSSLIGDNWWEQESPIKSQHSREAPQHTTTIINHSNRNSNSNSSNMIEYEKNIILEKLRMTELMLREVEKENKKLRKQIKILSMR
jgi:hypothetical protein